MVRMGNVWDRTVEVLSGRGGMLAGIAALTLFVPAVASAAWKAYAPAGNMTTAIGALLAILVTVVALWGQLAIIAASTDPATDRPAAMRQASARLLPALLVALVLGVILIVLFVPPVAILARAGLDVMALSRGEPPTAAIAPGGAALAGLYLVVLGIVMLFVGVRLLPLYAVVLHERLGLGAMARSWRLTRRHTWRLVGVFLLFLVVLLVATLAVQSVVGLVVRLILGADATATVAFLAALAGQAVSTALTLVAIVFSAQLYVALLARERLLRERAAQERGAT